MIALYARVSTKEQDSQMQIDDLIKHSGTHSFKLYQDVVTGEEDNRPGLKELMEDAKDKKFEKLVVWRFDRLFRSARHMLNHVDQLQKQGIEFVSLKEGVDTSTPIGKFFLAVMAAMSELELHTIKQRQRAGIAKAIKDGVKWGRQPTVSRERILALKLAGYNNVQIRKQLGCSRSTVIRVLRSEFGKVES